MKPIGYLAIIENQTHFNRNCLRDTLIGYYFIFCLLRPQIFKRICFTNDCSDCLRKHCLWMHCQAGVSKYLMALCQTCWGNTKEILFVSINIWSTQPYCWAALDVILKYLSSQTFSNNQDRWSNNRFPNRQGILLKRHNFWHVFPNTFLPNKQNIL